MEEQEFIIPEETPEEKIAGAEAMIAQYNRMIAENERQIGLGDDIDARKKMIEHLKNCIEEENKKIEGLK